MLIILKAFEFTISERFRHIMGTFGKGLNAFTIEATNGIQFYQINKSIMIFLQLICLWKNNFRIIEIFFVKLFKTSSYF